MGAYLGLVMFIGFIYSIVLSGLCGTLANKKGYDGYYVMGVLSRNYSSNINSGFTT